MLRALVIGCILFMAIVPNFRLASLLTEAAPLDEHSNANTGYGAVSAVQQLELGGLIEVTLPKRQQT